MNAENAYDSIGRIENLLTMHLAYVKPDQPTLRDQMAMAALTGMCSSLNFINGQSTEAMCAVAYDYADSMLKAREVQG